MLSPGTNASTLASDPSAPIKRYLAKEGTEAAERLWEAGEALVVASQVQAATVVTAKRMLQAEKHVDNTAMLLRVRW
jgi:hypothetical protein